MPQLGTNKSDRGLNLLRDNLISHRPRAPERQTQRRQGREPKKSGGFWDGNTGHHLTGAIIHQAGVIAVMTGVAGGIEGRSGGNGYARLRQIAAADATVVAVERNAGARQIIAQSRAIGAYGDGGFGMPVVSAVLI